LDGRAFPLTFTRAGQLDGVIDPVDFVMGNRQNLPTAETPEIPSLRRAPDEAKLDV
jgi:hypothetical protein